MSKPIRRGARRGARRRSPKPTSRAPLAILGAIAAVVVCCVVLALAQQSRAPGQRSPIAAAIPATSSASAQRAAILDAIASNYAAWDALMARAEREQWLPGDGGGPGHVRIAEQVKALVAADPTDLRPLEPLMREWVARFPAIERQWKKDARGGPLTPEILDRLAKMGRNRAYLASETVRGLAPMKVGHPMKRQGTYWSVPEQRVLDGLAELRGAICATTGHSPDALERASWRLGQ